MRGRRRRRSGVPAAAAAARARPAGQGLEAGGGQAVGGGLGQEPLAAAQAFVEGRPAAALRRRRSAARPCGSTAPSSSRLRPSSASSSSCPATRSVSRSATSASSEGCIALLPFRAENSLYIGSLSFWPLDWAEFLRQDLVELLREDLFGAAAVEVGRLADGLPHRLEHLPVERLAHEASNACVQSGVLGGAGADGAGGCGAAIGSTGRLIDCMRHCGFEVLGLGCLISVPKTPKPKTVRLTRRSTGRAACRRGPAP